MDSVAASSQNSDKIRTARLDVSVVLPCLNEQESVADCVQEALGAIHAAGWSGEVVVVDNGSTDESAVRAVAAGARVVAETVPGYGAAIRRGIAEARGAVVVMADADATYPLDRLAELVTPVRDGSAELMLGSRLHEATRQSMPFLHRFVGTPAITWLVKEGTGIAGLSDSQSGFRAFRYDIVTRLGLRSTGMEFASEMLVRAAQNGLVTHEVPLGYRDRVGESKLVTWRDGWRHLKLILRLSPQILLWKPGVVAAALGILISMGMIVWPDGFHVGTLTWRPIFLGSILIVLGVSAALSGALLARSSPFSSPAVQERFAWVERPVFLRRAMSLGFVVAATGLALDGLLFFVWVATPRTNDALRIALGAFAQALLLTGVIVVAVLAVYRLLLDEHRANSIDSSPDASGDKALE